MVGIAQGDHERLPARPDEISERLPDRRRCWRDLDLVDGHAVAFVVQHLIEELGQCRVQSEGTHAAATDLVGIDHPIGACLEELGLVVLVIGASDDVEGRVERSSRKRDVHIVGIGVERGDEGGRPFDAGAAQGLVLGGFADDDRPVAVGLGLAVDHHDLGTVSADIVDDGLSDAAVAHDDDVIRLLVDHAESSPDLESVVDGTLDERLERDTKGVERSADAEERKQQCEGLVGGRDLFGSTDLGKADRRDRDHGHVDRVKGAETEQQIADEPDHGDAREHADPDANAAPRVVLDTTATVSSRKGLHGAPQSSLVTMRSHSGASSTTRRVCRRRGGSGRSMRSRSCRRL